MVVIIDSGYDCGNDSYDGGSCGCSVGWGDVRDTVTDRDGKDGDA